MGQPKDLADYKEVQAAAWQEELLRRQGQPPPSHPRQLPQGTTRFKDTTKDKATAQVHRRLQGGSGSCLSQTHLKDSSDEKVLHYFKHSSEGKLRLLAKAASDKGQTYSDDQQFIAKHKESASWRTLAR